MANPRSRQRNSSSTDAVQEGSGSVPIKKNYADKAPLTLHPLQFDQAIRAALSAGKMPKPDKKPKRLK
jgi:hypothetical protein